MPLHVITASDINCGLRSEGHHPSQRVRAWCQCGWDGPRRRWEAGTRNAVRDDLASHSAVSGHREFPSDLAEGGPHRACGYFHHFDHDCPAPFDSGLGRLRRIGRATLGDPDAAADRLRAIAELRSFLDDQEAQAVVGARLTGVTWAEMSAAAEIPLDALQARWGAMVSRYENAGLLQPDGHPRPSGAPVGPSATSSAELVATEPVGPARGTAEQQHPQRLQPPSRNAAHSPLCDGRRVGTKRTTDSALTQTAAGQPVDQIKPQIRDGSARGAPHRPGELPGPQSAALDVNVQIPRTGHVGPTAAFDG